MIVLNGASSSGKSGIVRCLQAELPEPWLAYGCDSFVDSLPARMRGSDGGIVFAEDGGVDVGADFRALEAAWMEGIAAMARAGARIVVDDVFLGGAESQKRWLRALDGLDVLWVAVRCDPGAAAGREIARGDRIPGMAASQAAVVHEGVTYDLELDTTHTESMACARTIAARLRRGASVGPGDPLHG
ncbi:chloramphenicol phosphotransferase CPT [Streptomyces sp. NPDC127110]|uniref:chloramphenicol phosphotransferase CPT n=1 Tax=Streptomyces sp. NPDC127110 TaxID=3345362 RepID=UPI00363B27C3